MSSTAGFWLVTAPIIAVIAYFEAKNFAKRNGRPPWDVPPWGWALITACLGLLIGGILLVVARRATKPVSQANWPAVPPPHPGAAPAPDPTWAPPSPNLPPPGPQEHAWSGGANKTVWYPANN